MTNVESDEFRKARKERMTRSYNEGVRATLEKGVESDAEHERKPEPKRVRSTAEILAEAEV